MTSTAQAASSMTDPGGIQSGIDPIVPVPCKNQINPKSAAARASAHLTRVTTRHLRPALSLLQRVHALVPWLAS